MTYDDPASLPSPSVAAEARPVRAARGGAYARRLVLLTVFVLALWGAARWVASPQTHAPVTPTERSAPPPTVPLAPAPTPPESPAAEDIVIPFTPAPPPAPSVDSAPRDPLLVKRWQAFDALNTAILTGRDFAEALAMLRLVTPQGDANEADIAALQTLHALGSTPMPTPGVLSQRVKEAIPALLAAVPAPTDGRTSVDAARGWLRGVVTVRRTRADPQSPDATLVKLERAVFDDRPREALDLLAAFPTEDAPVAALREALTRRADALDSLMVLRERLRTQAPGGTP